MLITAIITALMLSFPLAHYLGGDQEFVLTAFGLRAYPADGGPMVVGTVYMGALIALAALLPLVNIFLYRKRTLQIRLCIVEIVLLLGVQIFVVYYIYHATSAFGELESSSASYTLADVIPLVSIVLMWLASRGIMKDEYIVRSLDRIR